MAVLLTPPYLQFFDSNGDPLNGGKVFTYEAGTLTPKATYSDNTEATPLANPIILNSAGRVVAWGSGSYKFIVKDSLDNTIETTDNVTVFNVSSGNIIPTADAGGTVDAITANYSPDIDLSDNVLVSFVSSGANTSTTPTFSPDGNTARTIVKAGGVALAAGDIGAAGAVHMVQYDQANTRWELLNPTDKIPAQAGNSGKVLTTNGTVVSWGSKGITSETPVASTSGTFIDFDEIPAGAKKITVLLDGVSVSGTSSIMVQLGDSGGAENTGYSCIGTFGGATGISQVAYTTGFAIALGAAAATITGKFDIALLDSANNKWVCTGSFARTDGTANSAWVYGVKSTSAVLDRIRLTTVNGTDTFDAGNVNIMYEF